MAIEAKRACGYRKVGGLYLMGGKLALPCCKMPILLDVCPTCHAGIKQSRGWQWIDIHPFIAATQCRLTTMQCVLEAPAIPPKVGLIWIGTAFYKTPADFANEAARMGVSRRIQSIPRGFRLGLDWVMFAHPHMRKIWRCAKCELPYVEAEVAPEVPGVEADVLSECCLAELKQGWQGGVFCFFRPTAIEKIVTATQAKDEEEMDKLRERGITPFVVPDDDPDHRGSVYDKAEEEPEGLFA
jgi:hypothetical protein